MSGKRTLIRNSVHFQVKKEWVEGGIDGPFKVFSVITRRWEWSVEEDFVNEKWWLTFIRRIFQRIRIIRGCREKGGGGEVEKKSLGGIGREVDFADFTLLEKLLLLLWAQQCGFASLLKVGENFYLCALWNVYPIPWC